MKNIITISGNLGSGKSKVSELLAQELNFKVFATGDIMRSIAEKNNMNINQFNDYLSEHKDLDFIVDNEVIELGKKEENLIFVSRLAWYFIPDSFKVYLYVDEKIGAKRILDAKRSSEKYLSYEDAIKSVHERFNSSRKRFMDNYGVDITIRDNYDLYIDTTNLSLPMVKQIILDGYKKKEGKNHVKKFINN